VDAIETLPFRETAAHIAGEPVSNVSVDKRRFGREYIHLLTLKKRQEETDRSYEERTDSFKSIISMLEAAIRKNEITASPCFIETGVRDIRILDHSLTSVDIASLKTWLKSKGMFPVYFFGKQEIEGGDIDLLQIANAVRKNHSEELVHLNRDEGIDFIHKKYPVEKYEAEAIWLIVRDKKTTNRGRPRKAKQPEH
jgi:hypothetical protein